MRKSISQFLTAALAMSVVATASAAPLQKVSANRNAEATSSSATVSQTQTGQMAYTNKMQKGVKLNTANSQFSNVKQLNAVKKNAGEAFKVKGDAPLSFPNLKGQCCYNLDPNWAGEGMYQVQTSAAEPFELLGANVPGTYGFAVLDGLYYAQSYQNTIFGAMFGNREVWNTEDWSQVSSEPANTNMQVLYNNYTDEATGKSYGCVYIDGTRVWGEMDWANNTATALGEAPGGDGYGYMGIGASSTGVIYGFGNDGKFGTIDKMTGAFTEISTLPDKYSIAYISAGCMDPKTNRFFAAIISNDASNTSYFLEIDPTNGEVIYEYQYPYAVEFVNMYVAAPLAEDGAPAAVENLAADFGEGNLNGTISFKMPATLFDGSAATGSADYKVLCNGEEVAAGNAAYGADVNVPVEVAAAGNYTFTVFAANAVGQGPNSKLSMFVGKDAPKAVTNVVATYNDADAFFEVTWDPVTSGFNNGYINPAEVTYTVTYFPSGEVIADGIHECTATVPQEVPESLTSFYFEVTASWNGMTSAPTKSNLLPLGNIVPPYDFTFSSPESLDGFTIIDNNGDGKTWTLSGNVMRVTYNSSKQMDDWLITPGIKMEAGKLYNVTMELRSNNVSWGNEAFEAYWGYDNTLAGMGEELIPETELPNTDFQKFSGMIVPDQDGRVYIGVHGVSGPDRFYLELQSISIAEGMDARVPQPAKSISVTPNSDGELEALVTVVAPDKAMTNAAVEGPLTATLTCDGVFAGAQEDINPGEEVEFIDEPAEGGYKTYSVKFSNAYGEGPAKSATAFVGINKPAAPASVTMAETATLGEVVINWDACDTDIDGQPLDADKVTYTVVNSANEVIAEGLTTTTLTYLAVPEGDQAFVYFGVYGVTDGGAGDVTVSNMEAVGTPFATPATESLANGELTYPIGVSSIGGGQWSIKTDTDFSDMVSADEDNGYVGMSCNNPGGYGYLYLPKFTLAGTANPTLSFYVYNLYANGNSDTNEFQVSITCDGSTTDLPTQVVGEIGGTDAGWYKVKYDLSAYANKVVLITLKATTQWYVWSFFDQFKIYSELDYNLAAGKIVAPAKAAQGVPFNVDVQVSNEGGQPAEGYSVELYLNNNLVATKDVEETLAAGAKATVSFEQTFGAMQPANNSYKAKVVYAADMEPNDNETDAVDVIFVQAVYPAPTNLTGNATAAGNVLNWTAPELGLSYGQVTETFEEGEGYDVPEGWTVLDLDGGPVGGFSGITVPGWTTCQAPSPGLVMDVNTMTSSSEIPDNLHGHNGSDRYFGVMFNYDASAQDDWLISPELPGVAQTVSFYAKSYSTQYGGEEIKVLYSTTGKEPADFIEVSEGTIVLPDDWMEVAYDLPAGAKYFAVECVSKDHFLLMMDDFTFVSGYDYSSWSIEGYNVWCDNEKVATVTETTYTHVPATEGVHAYAVTAIIKDYDGNLVESGISNIVELDTTTSIEALEAADVQADVYNMNGILMMTNASAKQLRSLPAGVYIFGTQKVVVR